MCRWAKSEAIQYSAHTCTSVSNISNVCMAEYYCEMYSLILCKGREKLEKKQLNFSLNLEIFSFYLSFLSNFNLFLLEPRSFFFLLSFLMLYIWYVSRCIRSALFLLEFWFCIVSNAEVGRQVIHTKCCEGPVRDMTKDEADFFKASKTERDQDVEAVSGKEFFTKSKSK